MLGVNINVPTTNADSGEGQEAAITAFLWNLYQQQFFRQNGFWNATTISGTYNLSNLVQTLNTQYPEYRSQIGALMGSFKIAPQMLTSTYTPGSSTPPTIMWRVNGSQNNPNNQFRIAFYNSDGVQKYETGNVSYSLTPAAAPNQNRRDLDTASYTLTQQEIDTALACFSSGETIHIAVKGFRIDSPLTGPYWSATIPEITEYLTLSSLAFTPINNNSEYSLTNILDKQFTGFVRIPSTYNGKPVTQIGNGAFQNSQLAQITIPSNVVSIDSNAFENCTNLEKVVIQRDIGTITSLGTNTFLGCSSLETIEVPTKRILDYLYATNWSNYSDFMHYIEPITDGLTITSVGEESEFYLFQVEATNIEEPKYNFYHDCTDSIDVILMDEDNNIIINGPVLKNAPILVTLEEGGIYKLVVETDENESFKFNADEVLADELTFETKYYETLNNYSYTYYEFTTDQSTNTSYTIHSDVVGARTNVYLYDSSYNLVTSSFGDTTHQGGKINYYLTPNTTYTILLFLISSDYYEDYTIQYYKTYEEVYHLDWGGISKQYFDPILYDYVSFTVLSSCYDLVFDETTKTITFGRIECFWDVTFEEYPNCPEEYAIGMLIGLTYNSFDSTLPFFSMNGIYQYQAALPYTYSYSATVTNVSITFSDVEWASYVTQGPRV